MSRREGESPARGCVQPYLPVWSDEVRKLQLPCEPPSCGNQENWVYTKHGRFCISEEIEKKVGKIYCEYTAIVYATDDANKVLEKINPMLNGSKLKSDVFNVSCRSSLGMTYQNKHAGIARNDLQPMKLNRTRYNVLMYGFDSISRNQMKRILPKTHEYFSNELSGHVLSGYNILGDGTASALAPMLAGRL